MSSILSGVRKFRLGLILAHQELRQLGQDSEVVNSVLSNPYTRICFRLGDADARKLATGFSIFEEKDLLNLSTGQAIVRIERAECDFNMAVPMLEAVEPELAEERTNAIREFSREYYATNCEDVEAVLNQRWEESAESDDQKEEDQEEQDIAAIALSVELADDNADADQSTVPDTGVTTSPSQQLPSSVTKDAKAKVKPPSPPSTLPSVEPPAPTLSGRGGQQHKYLQNLITQMAQGMGWRADIEKPVLDGAGSVDVALEKAGRKVACEISVTTQVDHELSNVEKCLKAGFDHVLAISTDSKFLNKLKQAVIAALPESELAKIVYSSPDEVITFLEQQEAQLASKEKTIRGWKVKVNFQPQSQQEKTAKKEAISEVILKRLAGKMKKKRD